MAASWGTGPTVYDSEGAAPCRRCDGCGQIADSESGESWSSWLALPLQSSLAVLMGMVKPIPCPKCGGTGRARRG